MGKQTLKVKENLKTDPIKNKATGEEIRFFSGTELPKEIIELRQSQDSNRLNHRSIAGNGIHISLYDNESNLL